MIVIHDRGNMTQFISFKNDVIVKYYNKVLLI